MRVVVALIAMCLFAGCGRKSDAEFLADAKAQVQRFFAAAATDDCTVVRAMLEKIETESDCQGFLHLWHEDAISLIDIVGAERDGRDKRAAIVRVRMQTRGTVKEFLVRAVRDPDRWKLVF